MPVRELLFMLMALAVLDEQQVRVYLSTYAVCKRTSCSGAVKQHRDQTEAVPSLFQVSHD